MEIETYDDKSGLISRLTKLAENGRYIFRGYSHQSQLLPSIVRKKLIDQEAALLFEFERSANQYLNTSNPVDFMSYAQHYGLATRLLDFTYNPFIALYFALFTSKGPNYTVEDDKKYYYIRYCDVEKNILIRHVPILNRQDFFEINSMAKRCMELVETIDMMFNKDYIFKQKSIYRDSETVITAFFKTIAYRVPGICAEEYIRNNRERIRNNALFFIDPNQSNQRLVMQQGLFLFPYTLEDKAHNELLNKNTGLIKINMKIRDELQRYLDTIGINSYRLMPDLSSVCEAVERKIRDERARSSVLFKKRRGSKLK